MTSTQERAKVRARFRMKENFTYQLKDANGNVKKMFATNKFGEWLMKLARKFVKNPIQGVYHTTTGQMVHSYVKEGFLNHLAAYGIQNFLTGKWVSELHRSNLITTAGKGGVASRINGSGAEPAFTYLAIGIGTTAADVADTTLESEITTNGGQRAAATASRVTTDTANDTARLVLTYTFTGSFAVTEAGALNASSNGVLLNRQVFTAVNVVSGDTLQITVNIDVD